MLKQETVPSGNGRTLETDQWGLGVGGRVEELMLCRAARGADGRAGQGWRKLWLWGPLCVWGDWLIGLSALNAGNQVVRFP